MQQQTFNFTDFTTIEIESIDGTVLPFNCYSNPVPCIARFLKCSTKKAALILTDLEKEYDVYTVSNFELALCKDNKAVYHFIYSGTLIYNNHEYQVMNEWSFRSLVEGRKPKQKKPPKPKTITLTCTERQLRKAKQLYYAMKIGFNIKAKDYQKWHLL